MPQFKSEYQPFLKSRLIRKERRSQGGHLAPRKGRKVVGIQQRMEAGGDKDWLCLIYFTVLLDSGPEKVYGHCVCHRK